MAVQSAGFTGSSGRCVVSCHKIAWSTVVRAAESKGDALAALFEPDWGNWKMVFGANVERFGSDKAEWIVIHGPGGPQDLGNAQKEEVDFLAELSKMYQKSSNSFKSVRFMSGIEYAFDVREGDIITSHIEFDGVREGDLGVVKGLSSDDDHPDRFSCEFKFNKNLTANLLVTQCDFWGLRVGSIIRLGNSILNPTGIVLTSSRSSGRASTGDVGVVKGFGRRPHTLICEFQNITFELQVIKFKPTGLHVGSIIKASIDITGSGNSACVSKGDIGVVKGVSSDDDHPDGFSCEFTNGAANLLVTQCEPTGLRVGSTIQSSIEITRSGSSACVSKGDVGVVKGLSSDGDHPNRFLCEFKNLSANLLMTQCEYSASKERV